MVKRALIIIGFILGALGSAGSALMLMTGAEGANPVVLVFWLAVLAVSIYYMRKNKPQAQ